MLMYNLKNGLIVDFFIVVRWLSLVKIFFEINWKNNIFFIKKIFIKYRKLIMN